MISNDEKKLQIKVREAVTLSEVIGKNAGLPDSTVEAANANILGALIAEHIENKR